MAAVARLDESAVVSMVSEVTNQVLDSIKPEQASLVIESTGARIPIVARLADVQSSLVHSASSCIIAEERCVLIWSNEPRTIINVAHNVEKQMLGFVSINMSVNSTHDMQVANPGTILQIVGPNMPTNMLAQTEEQSVEGLATPVRGAIDEKDEVYQRAIKVEEGEGEGEEDIEGKQPVRPVLRVHSFRIGVVMILVILTQSVGVSKVSRTIGCFPYPYTDIVYYSSSASGLGTVTGCASSW